MQKSKTQLQEKAVTDSQNLTHVLEQSIEGTLDKIELNLLAVADRMARSKTDGDAAPTKLDAYLALLSSRTPDADELYVIDFKGNITHGVKTNGNHSVSGNTYFQYLRDTQNAGTIVSDPILCTITHQWTILLARRLENADGSFAGAVFGTIRLDRFSNLFSSLDIGRTGTINLRNINMRIVARYPHAQNYEQDFARDSEQGGISSELREMVAMSPFIGSYTATVPYDNIIRTVSYRKLKDRPLYVLVGLAENDYLSTWRHDVMNSIIMGSFFALASFLFSLLLYRDWKARKEAIMTLENEQAKFRSLVSMSSDWFWEQDNHFRFTYISSRYLGRDDINSERLIGKTFWEVEQEEALPAYRRLVEAHHPLVNFELSFHGESGKKHFITFNGEPIFDEENTFKGYRGVGRDITQQKDATERERRLTNIYRALSETNEAILHFQDETSLFALVCRIVVDYGGMVLTWVGIPDMDNRIHPVSNSGRASAYLSNIEITANAELPEGKGPTGTAFRDGRTVVINDVRTNLAVEPWASQAERNGINSIMALPIKRSGKPYAILTVYSDETGSFDKEIVHLLEGMTANISYALDNADREQWRRQSEEALRESERRFRLVAEESPFPMQIHAEDGEMLRINRAWTELSGYTLEDIPTMQAWLEKLLDEEGINRTLAGIRAMIEQEARRDGGEYLIRCKDGSERIWHFFSSPLGQLADGRRAVISMAMDITERKKAENELKLAAMVYQDSSEAMMVTDSSNRIIAVNPAFEQITGFRAGEVLGKNPNFLKSSKHGKEFFRAMWKTIDKTGRWKGEIWNRAKNGEDFAILLSINTTFDSNGTVLRRVALFTDITKKKESDELIWNQANFDALTGLPNRRLFRDQLKHAIRKSRRTNQPLALMFLDLDGFKDVNDTLGHNMGDQLLKQAAERLHGSVREIDIVSRLGGDEFTVILSELSAPDNVNRVAQHILQQLSKPFHLEDEIAHVSASIGITLYPDDATDIEDLLKNADQAMYAAKQHGKNQYQYFTASMQEAALARMRLVNDMRVALENRQFEVFYQPIVELASGAIHKAEALIRWRHPVRGLIKPAEFIPLAEDTGMINSFGDWVFHEAANQAAKWRETHHREFQISVNISPVQFKKEGIDSLVWFEHLKSIGLPAQGIVVEITEGLLLEASENVMHQLLAFRDAGIEVALDDFGIGYSSLSYLNKFDIDYLKIDQAFVRNLDVDSSDMALCEAIIVMAHKLGLRVIAEGVETRKQRDLLASVGCDFAQGYIFSEPLPPEKMDILLKDDPFAFQEFLAL